MCYLHIAKTMELIRAFVFACAKSRFSHDTAQIKQVRLSKGLISLKANYQLQCLYICLQFVNKCQQHTDIINNSNTHFYVYKTAQIFCKKTSESSQKKICLKTQTPRFLYPMTQPKEPRIIPLKSGEQLKCTAFTCM